MYSVDLSVLLPKDALSKAATMQFLWLELLHINRLFGKPHLDHSGILQFEAMAKASVVKFCTICEKARVTPYIHAMHNHVGQFLRQHWRSPAIYLAADREVQGSTSTEVLQVCGVCMCLCLISIYSSMCDTYSSLPPNRATNMTSMEG